MSQVYNGISNQKESMENQPFSWMIFCLITGGYRYKSLSTNPVMASESCLNQELYYTLTCCTETTKQHRQRAPCQVVVELRCVIRSSMQCLPVRFFLLRPTYLWICLMPIALASRCVACMSHVKHDGTCQSDHDPIMNLNKNHRTSHDPIGFRKKRVPFCLTFWTKKERVIFHTMATCSATA